MLFADGKAAVRAAACCDASLPENKQGPARGPNKFLSRRRSRVIAEGRIGLGCSAVGSTPMLDEVIVMELLAPSKARSLTQADLNLTHDSSCMPN